jgi:uncharacterized membrane protein YhaH (DUF805 family)
MNFLELFSSKGKYSRLRYNIIETAIMPLVTVLIILIFVSRWFLLLSIPAGLVLWFIHIQSTVKRLHDLGRPDEHMNRLFIPFTGAFLHSRVHHEAGQDEKDTIAYRDYVRYRPKNR